MITGSNGFAAGNTLEEALVQGSCELYERFCIEEFYHNNIKYFYKINLNNLSNQYQKYISILKTKNIEINIYDCSYIINMPVLLLVAFVKDKNYFFYQFGAHPIFNIALERCFTELYQGIDYLLYAKKYQSFTQYHTSTWADVTIKAMQGSTHSYGFINENLIFNVNTIDSYNQNVFINLQEEQNNNITNKKLLQHIIKLNQQNNIDFYYTDISLSNDIKTVYLIQNKLTQTANINQLTYEINKYDNKTKKLILDLIQLIIIYYYNNIEYNNNNNNKILNQSILLNLKNILNKFYKTSYLDIIINLILHYLNVNFYGDFILSSSIDEKNNNNQLYLLLDILFEQPISQKYSNKEYKIYELYKLIESYYIQKYPKEKIKKILNWLHYEDIELDFELEDMTPLWYINKIFIEPLYDRYHSQEYYDFINIFGPDETITKKENVKILEDSN